MPDHARHEGPVPALLEVHRRAAADGDEQRMMLLGLKRFTKAEPFNSKDAKRRIANKLLSDNKYPL